MTASVSRDARWRTLERFLERPANPSLTHPDFEPGADNLDSVRGCKVLIIGAGGLGCELLKDLALMGFRNLHIIDMDTIDLSNLNRQFLFRVGDVGRPKAEVAAAFVRARVPDCDVIAHCCRIEEKVEDFYRSFNVVVCGLDSIQARRWINSMLFDLLDFSDDGDLDFSTVIPMIDGGTEGFKGNVRVIYPGLTPCIECTLDLYPPQINFPMCTIAHTPRLPEHCVEYVRVLLWPKESPFGDAGIDGDNPEHIQWIHQQSLTRAASYGISGVTLRLTQGVVKRIIPAVASTNACVAALCAQEVFKLATNSSVPLSNYANFQDLDGVSTSVVALEKREDCAVCSRKPQTLVFSKTAKLSDLIEHLKEDVLFQLRSPGVYLGARPLYVPSVPSLETATRPNLKKSLSELGAEEGSELVVADTTRPMPLQLTLRWQPSSAQDMELS